MIIGRLEKRNQYQFNSPQLAFTQICVRFETHLLVYLLCMVLIFLAFIRVKHACSEHTYNELGLIVK